MTTRARVARISRDLDRMRPSAPMHGPVDDVVARRVLDLVAGVKVPDATDTEIRAARILCMIRAAR